MVAVVTCKVTRSTNCKWSSICCLDTFENVRFAYVKSGTCYCFIQNFFFFAQYKFLSFIIIFFFHQAKQMTSCTPSKAAAPLSMVWMTPRNCAPLAMPSRCSVTDMLRRKYTCSKARHHAVGVTKKPEGLYVCASLCHLQVLMSPIRWGCSRFWLLYFISETWRLKTKTQTAASFLWGPCV